MNPNTILNIVQRQLGKKNVSAQDRLVEDLGAESADVINIITTVEETYNILISETELAAIVTVNDLIQLVESHQA